MSAAFRALVTWEGRTWDLSPVSAQVREQASIWDREFTPRTIALALPMGDTAALVADGAHYATMRVQVFLGGRLVSRAPVVGMRCARSGELTEVEVGNRIAAPRSGTVANPIPSQRTLTVTYIDISATQELRAQDKAAAQAEVAADRGWRAGLSTLAELADIDPRLRADYFPTVEGQRSEGRVYPIVIGRPGEDGGNPGSAGEAIPIEYDSTPRLMIAGHPFTGTVTVRGPKHGDPQSMAQEVLTTEIVTDATGRQVTAVAIGASTTLEHRWTTSFPEASEKPWFWWIDDANTAQGLSGAPVDVIALLLAHVTGIEVDRAALEGCREILAPYTLSGVIDVVADAWDLLTGQILPILPVALVSTPAGIGARPIRLDWRAADCRIRLVEGEGVGVIEGPRHVSTERDDAVCNRVIVTFDANKETGQLRRRAFATADRYGAAAASVAQLGERERVISTRWVTRRSVAQLIARDLVERGSSDRLLVSVAVDADRYGVGADGELQAGEPVLVSLPSYSLTSRVGIVTGILRRGTRVDDVELMLL